jgi:hypothetical protein
VNGPVNCAFANLDLDGGYSNSFGQESAMLYRMLTFTLVAACIVFSVAGNAGTGKAGESATSDPRHVAFPGSDAASKSSTFQGRKSSSSRSRPTTAGKKTN